MAKNNTVCIKALRERGGIIEWNYDTARQATKLWHDIVYQGVAPDTGCALVSACYFLDDKIEPHKYWEKPKARTIIDARTGKPVTKEAIAERFA